MSIPWWPAILERLLAGALAPSRRLRLALLSAGSVAGLGLGLLSLASLGLVILLGAGWALAAYSATPAGPRKRGLGAAGALTALAAVFVPTTLPQVYCEKGDVVISGGWRTLGGGGFGYLSASGQRGQ